MMYHGKEKLVAYSQEQNKPYQPEQLPRKVSLQQLPLLEDWMRWAVYSDAEDSPRRIELLKDIEAHNDAIDMIYALPEFKDLFIENHFCLNKETITNNWGAAVADKLFGLERTIFTPNVFTAGDLFKGRYQDDSPEYQIDIPDYGSVRFVIRPSGHVEYSYPTTKNRLFFLNRSDDERDFTYYLWRELEDMYESAEDESGKEYTFGSYECWDQGRFGMGQPDPRLVKCLSMLEEFNYLRTYSIRPETPHASWNGLDKSDSSLDAAVLDKAYTKDKLLCEKLKLVINSPDVYMGEKVYFLTQPNNRQIISLSPGQFGGHNRLKIYGRLDCPSAARYIEKGQYIRNRVFFESEDVAKAAGYRPCGVCMKQAYIKWKQGKLN